jgi:mannosyltransferase
MDAGGINNESPSRPGARTGLLALALLSLAALLRLYHIGQGFQFDEYTTLYDFVRQDWLTIICYAPIPNNHILYSLLAKIPVTLFGEAEWTLRLPALIFGAITPPACFLLWRRRFGDLNAFLAALFICLSFWAVWFSQDARGYSGMVLFAAVTQSLYLSYVEKGGKKTAWLYLLSGVAGCYLHLYFIFVICGQIAWGFFRWIPRRKSSSAMIFILPGVALAIAIALHIPVLLQLYGYATSGGRERSAGFLHSSFFMSFRRMLYENAMIAPDIILFLFFLAGLYRLAKKWPEVVWLNLFAAVFVVLFTFGANVTFYARFMVFLLPFFFLALAMSFDLLDELAASKLGLQRNLLKLVLSVMVCLLFAYSLSRYYRMGKQDFRAVSEYIDKKFPGHPVISYGMDYQTFLFYNPGARAMPSIEPMTTGLLEDYVVVGSYRWSWSSDNRGLLENFCKLEKKFKSAAYHELDLYLYRCF